MEKSYLKKYFSLAISLCTVSVFAQTTPTTYVADSTLVTIASNTLYYNSGGIQLASAPTTGTPATIDNYGNIMVVGTSTDEFKVDTGAEFNLKYAADLDTYGQLYITGFSQENIGNNANAAKGVPGEGSRVNKEYYKTDDNSTSQQIGLPFYKYTISDLTSAFQSGTSDPSNDNSYLNVNSTALNNSGRFAYNSAFWWNNARARFDQIAYNGSAYDGNGVTTFLGSVNPMTYYILPKKNNSSFIFWNPGDPNQIKEFKGIPASDEDSNVKFNLAGAAMNGGSTTIDFGANGTNKNTFQETYASYIDDVFQNPPVLNGWNTPNKDNGYGKNIYQLANPFLTNIDISLIGTNNLNGGLPTTGEPDSDGDGVGIPNLYGVAYYEQAEYVQGTGTTSLISPQKVMLIDTNDIDPAKRGLFQAGDPADKVFKPMTAFMIKLQNPDPTTTTAPPGYTLDFKNLRTFSDSPRIVTYTGPLSGSGKGTTTSGNGGVKQVAVVMYNADGIELGRTYYAVAQSAVTGYNNPAILQAYNNGSDTVIYTKEEKPDGGEDTNYTSKLYINSANEDDFKTKEIPLYINNTGSYTLKFEIYERGKRMPNGLSNGESFYIKDSNNVLTKITDGASFPMMSGNQNFGLYYQKPNDATMGTNDLSGSQTIIAKKNGDWVVRFAKDWKRASVEVYSAAGQLLSSKANIYTGEDYLIPVSSQVKGVYVVKAVSEKGEVVVKKIIN